jgi:endonuclease/exonuclease/phosphatase family metal-dependent hydrolase
MVTRSRRRTPRDFLGHLTLVAVTVSCMPSYDPAPTSTPRLACLDRGIGPTALSWYSPASPSENQQLERWCSAIGPPALDSVPTGRFGSLAAGDSLAIVVWNTDAGAGRVEVLLETEMHLECRGQSSSLAAGASHFVLLVQEALRRSNDIPAVPKGWVTPPPVKENERPGDRRGVAEVARLCGLAYLYLPAARNGWEGRDGAFEDKGNAILSTLPLHDLIGIELPLESARRVVPAATIRNAKGDSLRLASVHLITTPQAWRVLVTGNSARERQALGLIAALDSIEQKRSSRATTGAANPLAARGISTLVAGDLNTWSTRETALRVLRKSFPESPPLLDEPTRGPFPTDHVLFRRNTTKSASDAIVPASYRVMERLQYSDHEAIVAWFKFGQ